MSDIKTPGVSFFSSSFSSVLSSSFVLSSVLLCVLLMSFVLSSSCSSSILSSHSSSSVLSTSSSSIISSSSVLSSSSSVLLSVLLLSFVLSSSCSSSILSSHSSSSVSSSSASSSSLLLSFLLLSSLASPVVSIQSQWTGSHSSSSVSSSVLSFSSSLSSSSSLLLSLLLLFSSLLPPVESIHSTSSWSGSHGDSSWSGSPSGSHSEFSCEPITLRMCQNLPYNFTFMPNLLQHYDQHTAALAMEPFHPMVNLECSSDLRMFLCALYTPVCTTYGQVSLPCRSLCQNAKTECHKLMEVFGVNWPEDMDCSRFPDCADPYPRPVDLLLPSDPEEGGSPEVQRDYGFWCPRELKLEADLGYSFMGRRDCSPPCPSMFFTQHELNFIRNFVGVVSIVCLSATLFTFLTFLIDVTRFRYPERPIIFYAVCYVMVSLVFFLGFLLEDRVACNAASPAHFRAATVTQGSHNKVCTLLFMVLYFFTMAGSVWWVILTITWFLAAVPKWGSEAIEKKSLVFHAVAWGLPGALTVTLLALNKIEGRHHRSLLHRPLRHQRPEVVRPHAALLQRGRGRVSAAGGHRGSEPRPDGDPSGEGESDQAGEVHDPDGRVLGALPGAAAHRDWLLPV